MTKPATVLTTMFHGDWLKYFKPLHAAVAGAVQFAEKPEKHTDAGSNIWKEVACAEG